MIVVSGNAKLVVIFNHRFEGNLPLLAQIYGDRFDPTYLMPFYRGDDPAVRAVFASSHHFHGFVAQGYPDYHSDDATHYVFAGDDVFLKPRLTASTIVAALGLSETSGYIKGLNSLADAPISWMHLLPAVRTFHRNTGVEYSRELPVAQEAWDRVARHTVARGRLGPRSLLGLSLRPELRRTQAMAAAYFLLRPERRTLPYPLLWTYSDVFVVPAPAMAEFARLCGIFAAMGLFVEVAVPTALALACEHLRTEQPSGLLGQELWTVEEQRALVERFGASLRRLTGEFPEDWLYVHPVKLSQWNLT